MVVRGRVQVGIERNEKCYECVWKHQICIMSPSCNSECLRREGKMEEDLCPHALFHIGFVTMCRAC